MKRFTKITTLLFLLLTTAWSTVMGQTKIDPPFDETRALKASDITAGKTISLWVLNMDPNRWVTRIDNTNNKRSADFTENCLFVVENADGADGSIVLKRKTDGKYMQKNNGIQWSENKSEAVKFTVSHPGDNFSYTDSYLNPAPEWDPNYATYLVRFTEAGTPNFLNGNDATGFATGNGSWSAFLVREYTLEDEITQYVSQYTNVPDNSVNGLTSADKQTLLSMPKVTEEDFQAIKEFVAQAPRVAFSADKAYRLTTPGRTQKNYMTMNADFLTGTAYDTKNASLIWKFTGDAENGYTMSCQGRYAVEPQSTEDATTGTSQKAPSTDNAEQASLFKLNEIDNKVALWGIKPNNDGLHLDANFNIVGWTNGDASEWYLVEATTIDVDITAAGYATVNYPFAVQVPDGVIAYTGTADAAKEVFTLNKIESGIIPANTPVVLEGAEGTHTLTILADNTTQALESGLEGTLLSKEITETNTYILGNKDSHVGFYQMDAEDRTLGANKAYLILSPETSPVRSLIFSDGTTTGIESTVAEGAETEEYYDLQGRRVMNPTKGIYVTKSGKKVLFNK